MCGALPPTQNGTLEIGILQAGWLDGWCEVWKRSVWQQTVNVWIRYVLVEQVLRLSVKKKVSNMCQTYTCIHAYMQIYVCKYACMHVCMYAYIHACRYACMHASIHAYLHACIHAYMHTCIHAYMHTRIHAYMHTCIHAYMHTCIHAYMHILGSVTNAFTTMDA